MEKSLKLKEVKSEKKEIYKEIAIAIRRPKSYRAVANACGKNPYPVEIPCHRVIRSNGEIGGYSTGGSKVKRILLSKEI
mgnify:CR=1 FL=1